MTMEKQSSISRGEDLLNSQFISQIFEAAQKSTLVEADEPVTKEKFNRESFKLKVAQRMISDLESERQSLETQIRLLKAAVECSNDGISISDMNSPDNEIIFVSPKLEELTGYTSDELVGSNWRKLYQSEPDTKARELLRSALAEGRECQTSVRNIRKDGTPFLSKVTLYPLLDNVGDVSYYVSVIQDETEKRQTAQALAQAQRLDSIGLMAGGIVHDFNNILQGVLVQASIAMRKMNEADSAYKHVDLIERAGKRAVDLTQRLLKYAREEGFDQEELCVKDLVDESIGLIASSLSSSIQLSTHIHDNSAMIRTFKGQTEQILINLVLNAAESITDHGFIRVSSRLADQKDYDLPEGLVDFSYLSNVLEPSRKYVVLEVIDTGSGMELDTLKRIFDPFFTTKNTGNGLGLAVTLGAVQAQNGALRVESQIGIGSQFSIYLPLWP